MREVAINPLIPADGDGMSSSGVVMTVDFSVPIQGWKKERTVFLGNLTPTEFVQTPGSIKPVMYSAKVTDGAATTTISREMGSFINGVCSNGAAGTYACTLETGAFSSTPNCFCNVDILHDGTCTAGPTSATNVGIEINTSGTKTDRDFSLFCHGVQ
jgi:hypothetical protein